MQQEQESLNSSHSRVWTSSPTTVLSSSEGKNSSPAHSGLLRIWFEELAIEDGECGFDDGLVVVSQFNGEWDTINYPSSSGLY